MVDKTIYKAFEEVTTRNVKAGIEHGNETRRLFRELEKKVDLLEGNLRQTNERLDELKRLLVNIQAKIYQGGTK